jgi:hypothetical protein
MQFALGQRVRTTVDAPAAWPGALNTPIGSLGTITMLPTTYSDTYGVVIDHDPHKMPLTYEPHEITPA